MSEKLCSSLQINLADLDVPNRGKRPKKQASRLLHCSQQACFKISNGMWHGLLREILYGTDDTHDYHRYGEDWCRASARKTTRLFPYLTIHQVKEAVSVLIDGGMIRKGSYNDNRFDKTNWYSFTEFGKLIYG